MNVLARMALALDSLAGHWSGRRTPKAFYLRADDWAEFMAFDPPLVETSFGNNPPRARVEPAFQGIPVRASDAAFSRLYDNTTAGRELPYGSVPRGRPQADRADISAEEVLAGLDALSRTRALSDSESLALEAAMKGRVLLSKRDAARLGIKRQGYGAS